MNQYLALSFRSMLLRGATIVLAAQSQHITAFTGAWKINVGKSSFDPGPPFKSFNITFTSDGVRHLELVGADGQPVKLQLPWSDGKEVHVTGMENATATSKIQGRTFHDIWKRNGKTIEDVRGVISADGGTLTIAVAAMYQEGHPIHNHLTFEKQ